MSAAVRAVALTLICLALVTVRVVWSSRSAWQAAQSATGDERTTELGRAARLYAPGNPYARRAREALRDQGRAGGADALAAWRELRSAILATRSIYTPERALLDEANQQIAALSAAAEPDTRGPLAERQAWHAARLAQDDAPAIGWTLVALAGLALWIGAAVGFFMRAVDEHDRLRRKPALAWAVGVAAGLAFFFLGLARA
jgi:hypothetical protein